MNHHRALGALIIAVAMTITACGGGGAGTATTPAPSGDASASTSAPAGEAGGSVGVSMPTQTSERWIADGEAVKSQLEEAGFEVDLETGRASIEAVLGQFLDHGGGPFDDLACGDLVGELGGETVNPAHGMPLQRQREKKTGTGETSRPCPQSYPHRRDACATGTRLLQPSPPPSRPSPPAPPRGGRRARGRASS